MLQIHYGIRENTVSLVDSYFKHNFDAEWLNDDLVKEMVLDVDKSKVIAPYCIDSPVLGQISPFMLSGGVKALILMLKTNYIVNASMCGDNCSKWIIKIAEEKDLEIDLEHVMYFDDTPADKFRAVLINKNVVLNSYLEYLVQMSICMEEEIANER